MSKENHLKFELYSNAFKNGEKIPDVYSGTNRGKNISPPLCWINIPNKTRSFVLTLEDIDTPMPFALFAGKSLTHWILYNIPSDKREVEEGIPIKKVLEDGSIQGKNVYLQNRYNGPAPIWGTHRYLFTIYALDIMINSKKIICKKNLMKIIQIHILGKAQIMGYFSKKIKNAK